MEGRQPIIANYLRNKGYIVNYAYVNKPKIVGTSESFNYHIAACVEINGQNYVVDPLYSLEGQNTGLSKYDDWVKFQEPVEGETEKEKNRIIPGYDSQGNIVENNFILYFYKKNKNKSLSVPEFAERLLLYFSKTGKLSGYYGGDISE